MRRSKFTPLVVEQIPRLVDHGKSPAEIAKQIGCKTSTLRVRCSQLKISLRRDRKKKTETSHATNRQPAARLTVSLSPMAVGRLRQQADVIGMSEAQFAAALLEVITRDNLYEAVLNRE